jgi:BirA family biotin operon repressor/biotin-[acetyl-CoA-carboxylase] ligase
MLSEMEAEADMVHYVNIGLGINVNNSPMPKTETAVSIKQILEKTVLKKALLTTFLDTFESRLSVEALDDVLLEWKKWSVTLHRNVRVETLHDVIEGVAEDVDENGGLIVRQANGSLKTIFYGDCFHT